MVLTQLVQQILDKAAAASFHTTMVLTQRKPPGPIQEVKKVSIPLWFLRNRLDTIHYLLYSIVSIPLWFLRNSTEPLNW